MSNSKTVISLRFELLVSTSRVSDDQDKNIISKLAVKFVCGVDVCCRRNTGSKKQ